MKPFDLEAAKKGAAVCTRDGRDARIVCWDYKKPDYPILALVPNDIGEEEVCSYSNEGYKCYVCTTNDDLFMKSVKATKWTNVYTDLEGKPFVEGAYRDEEEAKKNIIKTQLISYVATSKVEWGE